MATIASPRTRALLRRRFGLGWTDALVVVATIPPSHPVMGRQLRRGYFEYARTGPAVHGA